MRRYRSWTLLTVLLLSVLILWQAPAKLFVLLLQNQFPELTVVAAHGTIWRGKAHGLSWHRAGRALALNTLAWKIDGYSFFLLRPAVDIDGQLNHQRINGRLSMPLGRSLRVDDLALKMPASKLPIQHYLPLSGELSIDIEKLILADLNITDVVGRVVLQQAVIGDAGANVPLGSFAAELEPFDGGVLAKLFDLGGAGQLDGELLLKLNGQYRVEGMVSMREGSDAASGDWLSWLGEPMADDRVHIVKQGSLW